MASVRAIYRNGQLELLDPVNLRDGEQVQVEIEVIGTAEWIQDVLGDLIAKTSSHTQTEIPDEATLIQQIDRATEGVTLSDAIIEERQSGI